MTASSHEGAVDLAGGRSATDHLQRALAATARGFPEVFGDLLAGVDAPDFKRSYPEVLPRFEAARLASPHRSQIAAALVAAARDAIAWATDDGERPLCLGGDVPPFELATSLRSTDGRLRPRVRFGGTELSGDALVTEVGGLVARGSATPEVAESVEWIVAAAGDDGIDLSGRRIVVLGAAAELAPTRMWLEGGADVLWIDVVDPPADLVADEHAGALSWVAGGVDLLTQPARIRATIERFANGDAVDIGLYAYAAGRAREWRLTAAMNAVVDALPADTVRGVAMLLSPTTCSPLTATELAGEERRIAERPRWQAALVRARLLGDGVGHVGSPPGCVNRAIVSIQGGSYQAAQYLGKLMAAEAWATADRPIAVSANTAGISLTESLHHPVFDVAFAGAAALGVETFEPAATAQLNGLLTLRDRLDPESPGDVDALFATRVHGGIGELPFPVEPALRVAAALGVAKDPRRIGALVRRR